MKLQQLAEKGDSQMIAKLFAKTDVRVENTFTSKLINRIERFFENHRIYGDQIIRNEQMDVKNILKDPWFKNPLNTLKPKILKTSKFKSSLKIKSFYTGSHTNDKAKSPVSNLNHSALIMRFSDENNISSKHFVVS
jgi:hypothetical protein